MRLGQVGAAYPQARNIKDSRAIKMFILAGALVLGL